MGLIDRYKKFLTVNTKKLERFFRALKRTAMVLIIICFGALLGMSIGDTFARYLPKESFITSSLITVGIIFVILIYYNYLMESTDN